MKSPIIALFASLLVASAATCQNVVKDCPVEFLLCVTTPGPTNPQSDKRTIRMAIIGKRENATSVVTASSRLCSILVDDGRTLLLLFGRGDDYINYKGKDLKVAVPLADLKLVEVNKDTVTYLNGGDGTEADFGSMPKLKEIRFVYDISSGQNNSSYWRGSIKVSFDVSRSDDGLATFGGKYIGTFDGKIISVEPPKDFLRPEGEEKSSKTKP
jgi:hypothetical protein